jgi:hypothetical protein
MNHTQRWISAVVLAFSFAACGQSDDAAKPKAPPPQKETVFDDMIATKARSQQEAERAMQQNKEKLEAAMKKADEAGAAQ